MSEIAPSIAAFLAAVRTGEWQAMEPHYRADVVFEGTVPRWYFTIQGRQQVIRKMGDWFPCTANVSDVHVMMIGQGAVVEFERRWRQPVDDQVSDTDDVGVRQAHVFQLDPDGRIRAQRGHCAGIWDAATFAEVERSLSSN